MAESATRTESVRMYVISPTGPSAPTSMPSYSCCAIRIVTAAEKPSCFAASCCNALVRNGGGARRRPSPFSPALAFKGGVRPSPTHAPPVASPLISRLFPSGVGDRVLGDLVEQDAPHLAAVRELARHVPRDGLALAVRVGGEEHPLRGFRGLLDFGEGLGLLLDGHVLGREAVLDVHAELALRQIAQVPHGRLDGVARAQVLADRLRLGGRLDDDECALPAPALRGGRLGLPRASLGSHGHGGLRASVIPGLATGVGLFPFHRFFLSSHASILRQTTRVRIFTIPHSIAQASRPRSPPAEIGRASCRERG